MIEEILRQLIGRLSHYLQGFLHPRLCRTSCINGRKIQQSPILSTFRTKTSIHFLQQRTAPSQTSEPVQKLLAFEDRVVVSRTAKETNWAVIFVIRCGAWSLSFIGELVGWFMNTSPHFFTVPKNCSNFWEQMDSKFSSHPYIFWNYFNWESTILKPYPDAERARICFLGLLSLQWLKTRAEGFHHDLYPTQKNICVIKYNPLKKTCLSYAVANIFFGAANASGNRVIPLALSQFGVDKTCTSFRFCRMGGKDVLQICSQHSTGYTPEH